MIEKYQEQVDLWLEEADDALSQVEKYLTHDRTLDTGFGDHSVQDKTIDTDMARARRIRREIVLFRQERQRRIRE